MDEQALRDSLALAVQGLWMRSLMPGGAGLLTVEMSRRRYLVTPPGARWPIVLKGDLLAVDLGGVGLQGGRGVDEAIWRPHRVAYTAGLSRGPNEDSVRATALTLPAELMGLSQHLPDGETQLGSELLAIFPLGHPEIEKRIAAGEAVLIREVGLFVAAGKLTHTLNRSEMIAHAAVTEVAARKCGGC